MANLNLFQNINKLKNILLSKFALLAMAIIIATFAFTNSVSAAHSWGGYHWARQSNPFTLKLSSNLSSSWQPYLATTSNDWSVSAVIDTTIINGVKNPKTCKPTSGRVEVCNANYGNNGWLGLAQIWISGGMHITQGVVKINDTYMTRAPYNTPEEKNHVMCQEVGHTFGLGHQSETGAALSTCMDYSSDVGSQKPNGHDYYQLEQIYAHLDTTTSVDITTATSASADNRDTNNNQNWGRRIFRSKSGLVEIYERQHSDGSKLVSFVNLAHHQ